MGNTKSTPEAPPIANFFLCQDTEWCKRYRVENARSFLTTAYKGTEPAVQTSVVESVAMKKEATLIAEMLAPRPVAFSSKLLVPKGTKLNVDAPVNVEHIVTMDKGGDLLRDVYVIQYRLKT